MKTQASDGRFCHSLASLVTLAGGTLLLVFGGCGGPDAPARGGEVRLRAVEIPGLDAHCVTLYAGQTIDVGTVCAEVDPDVDTSAQCGAGSTGVLRVTYGTTGGWLLYETHLAVGDEFDDFPVNGGGNLKVGQFPYGDDDLGGVSSHAIEVPLCLLGLDGADASCDPVTAYLAAHAVVKKSGCCGGHQEETAWGHGPEVNPNGGSWATYFTVPLECEPHGGGTTDGADDDGDDGDGKHEDG